MPAAEQPRVLVISSVDPTRGTGTVAFNFYRALKNAGIQADFLTRYPVEDHPEILHVFPQRRTLRSTLAEARSRLMGNFIAQQGNHDFDYAREDRPPVPPSLVLAQIRKPYDVVYIIFWYKLLSYRTVEAIYDKLHCQIHFRCADNQPVAGGCHFIGDCPRLEAGCGSCPGLKRGHPQDFTAFNIRYRRAVLERVRPLVYGNTHMQQIYRRCALLKDYDRLITAYPLVDNAFFHPVPQEEARRSLGMAPEQDFVLFFGCSQLDEERKGMRYLLEALRQLHAGLEEPQRRRVVTVMAGKHAEALQKELPFASLNLGFVPIGQLPTVYSAASAFLCPSVDDAGPSMVNQSLSCGTPVVAFHLGTALDMVDGHNTGYCAATFKVAR